MYTTTTYYSAAKIKSFIIQLPTDHAPTERAKQAVCLGTEKASVKGMNVVFTSQRWWFVSGFVILYTQKD